MTFLELYLSSKNDLLYTLIMIKKAIIHSNPYLEKSSQRDKLFAASTASSTAIEGVRIYATKKRRAAKRK